MHCASINYGWVIAAEEVRQKMLDTAGIDMVDSGVLEIDWTGDLDDEFQVVLYFAGSHVGTSGGDTMQVLDGLPEAPLAVRMQMIEEAERLGFDVAGDPQWLLYASVA